MSVETLDHWELRIELDQPDSHDHDLFRIRLIRGSGFMLLGFILHDHGDFSIRPTPIHQWEKIPLATSFRQALDALVEASLEHRESEERTWQFQRNSVASGAKDMFNAGWEAGKRYIKKLPIAVYGKTRREK